MIAMCAMADAQGASLRWILVQTGCPVCYPLRSWSRVALSWVATETITPTGYSPEASDQVEEGLRFLRQPGVFTAPCITQILPLT